MSLLTTRFRCKFRLCLADTGYDGKPYTKKTDKSMCDELGDEEYMRAYVNDFAPKPCTVSTGVNCSDKEVKFTQTWRAKSIDDRRKEQARLEKIGQTLVYASSFFCAFFFFFFRPHHLPTHPTPSPNVRGCTCVAVNAPIKALLIV